MRIRVLINWGAANSFQRVLPGEYDINDPALMGMGRVILSEGHAVVIEDAALPVTVEVSDEPEAPEPKKSPGRGKK